MPITVGQIKKILGKLDGVTFTSREELENAVYPLFGPLQPAMPGMTYRDLVDILVQKGWVVWDRGDNTHVLKFPPEKGEAAPLGNYKAARAEDFDTLGLTTKADQDPNPSSFNPSFREIALLVGLHSNGSTSNDLGFDSLIAKGLVEYVNISDPISEEEADGVKQNIATSKTQIVAAIVNDDFTKASDIIIDIIDAENYMNSTDNIFKLTDTGKSYMQDQADSLLD
jgi:hypothetical protein